MTTERLCQNCGYARDMHDVGAGVAICPVQTTFRPADAGAQPDSALVERLQAENARLREGLARVHNTINVVGSPYHRAMTALDDMVNEIKSQTRGVMKGAHHNGTPASEPDAVKLLQDITALRPTLEEVVNDWAAFIQEGGRGGMNAEVRAAGNLLQAIAASTPKQEQS